MAIKNNSIIKMFGGGVIFFGLIFSLILTTMAIYTVDAGEKKIVKRFGEATSVSSEGLHFKMPFIDSTETVDVKTHKVEGPNTAGTSDLQTVSTKVSLNYHYDNSEEALLQIIRKTGFQDIDNKIIIPRINEAVKSVTALYTAENLLKKRGEVKLKIDDKIRQSLTPYNLVVEDVQLTDFRFSKSFSDAIEVKQAEEQRALTARNILERNKTEAEAAIVKAKAEAEAIKIQTEAIQSQGGSEYVKLKAIEKWDGKMPQYSANGAMPFIDVKPTK